MAPAVEARYQRASDLLEDVLKAVDRTPTRPVVPERQVTPVPVPQPSPVTPVAAVQADAPGSPWTRPRDTPPQPRFCWNCRKPLHARSDRCPFCGEAQ
jgi:hypothetical protein